MKRLTQIISQNKLIYDHISDDDDILLSELNRGSMAAYQQIFLKYHKFLCTEAFNLLGDEMESDDIVQVLFIEIWDKKLYLNINSIKSYLRIAVRNKCLSKISKNSTKRKLQDIYHLNFEEQIAEDYMERNELNRGMTACINELPSQRLHAFDLVYMQGKPYKEAAIEMGITVNSLKTHLKLAVKMLRIKLQSFR